MLNMLNLYDPDESMSDFMQYKEDSQRLDNAGEWMQEILDILYGKKYYDEKNFEFAIEELAHCVRLNIPRTDLTITNKVI